MAGERMPDREKMVCIMPLARGNCASGTSIATDVSKAALWKAPVRAASRTRVTSDQRLRLPAARSSSITRESSPEAQSMISMVRLRSWRSAQAPARGAPKTMGRAKARLIRARAKASSGRCSGRG